MAPTPGKPNESLLKEATTPKVVDIAQAHGDQALLQLVRLLARQAARDLAIRKARSRGQMPVYRPGDAGWLLQLLILVFVVSLILGLFR